MSLDADIVDAIAEDIELESGLPDHRLFRYRRPRMLLPKMCPALVVWLEQERPIPERGTTIRFEYQYTVGVSWHEQTIDEAVTGVNSEDISRSLLNAKEAIRERVHVLATKGLATISEAWSVMPGGSRYFQTPREEGLTEGYAFSVLVTTTQH